MKAPLLATAIAVSLLLAPAASPADPGLVRTIAAGRIAGARNEAGALTWLGIPYAAPPTGELRWRRPHPARAWPGIRAATAPGTPCSQPGALSSDRAEAEIGSEDCLYLNIWRPDGTTGNLPVMLWVHGGGNQVGNGAAADGSTLAIREKVIVVGINYRLGAMGWFRHAALSATAQDAAERSGNFALLDILAALRWVRLNIGAFGGDSRRITVSGESAGAQNIYALLGSPEFSGYFDRAIVQSGGDLTMSTAEAENAGDDPHLPGVPKSSAEVVLRLLIADGLAADRMAARAYAAGRNQAWIADYLRRKGPDDFSRAYASIDLANGLDPSPAGVPQLFRDGHVLSARPILDALKTSRAASVPLMIGTTRDEFSVLLPLGGNTRWTRKLSDGGFTILDKDRYRLGVEYLSDLWKASGVDAAADVLVARGLTNVYVYRFDWNHLAPPSWLGGLSLGAPHGIDVPFVFGDLAAGAPFETELIARADMPLFDDMSVAMTSYWAAFARDGRPGKGQSGALPLWQDWQAGGTMILDAPITDRMRMAPIRLTRETILSRLKTDPRLPDDKARCALLDALTGGPARWAVTPAEHHYLPDCKN
jgi:para-nitrobenzyl esterase